MHALRIVVIVAWVILGIYWFASAFAAKQGSGAGRRVPLNALTALVVVLVLRFFSGGSHAVHSQVLGGVGALVCVAGIASAI